MSAKVPQIPVLVTQMEFDKAAAIFKAAAAHGLDCRPAPADEHELAVAVSGSSARFVIVGADLYSGPLYRALPAGGVIARFGVGHDGVDKALASARGILCTNTPGVLDDSVAEFTMALILSSARGLTQAAAACQAGNWIMRLGTELRGKRVAIIGCGAIGCRVARIASLGFGLEVLGYSPRPRDTAALARDFGFACITTDFAGAVSAADWVSLHIPGNPSTRHFMDAARLALLKPGAWLINTARGAVVDELSLFDSLAAGRLGGAALDVFAQEPYVPAHPAKDLRTLKNVLMTPHLGSSTREACDRMAARSLRNIALALAGKIEEMDLLNRL